MGAYTWEHQKNEKIYGKMRTYKMGTFLHIVTGVMQKDTLVLIFFSITCSESSGVSETSTVITVGVTSIKS